MFLGTAGTGGALGSAGLPLPGDAGPWLLPLEETELRRTMRFVTVSPTGVGVVTWVRRAAAAAADERLPLDSRSLTKAFVAARDADALGGARWGGFDTVRLRLPNMAK